MRKPTRPLPRPLLMVGAGLGLISVAVGCFTSGNLVAPRCPSPDQVFDDNGNCVLPDGGVPDAGATDGGP